VSFEKERREIIFWGRQLNRKGFVTARSGNISKKIGDDKIMITSHDSYLGFLEDNEVLLTDLNGNVLEGNFEPAVEKDLHLGIYRKFEEVKVVMHAHSPFSTAFFHYYKTLDTFSFESAFYLGKVPVVPQETPTVTDIESVLSALRKGSIVVLKNHGIVSIGENFKSAYGLIELLEDQAKINFSMKNPKIPSPQDVLGPDSDNNGENRSQNKYILLSEEHCERLAEIVNTDKEAQDLGQKHDLTCTLAIKNQDTGHVVRFYYEKGKIVQTDNNENADFIIAGKEDTLKGLFNGDIDPFVAATQQKVKTKGDFAKISRWYPALVRTFRLWEHAPVE